MLKTIRLLAALTVLTAACGAPPSRQAAEFALPDLAGKTTSLSSLRGKLVLVNFWATWCDSCKEEMPAIQELHERLGPKGLVILGVSVDDSPMKVIPPFLQKYKATFPILLVDRKTEAAYGVRGLPTSFLIDGEGQIVRRWVGPLDLRAVENDILALLNRRPS